MMLWDLIRDFLVKNIFGGNASDGSRFAGKIGSVGTGSNSSLVNSSETFIPIELERYNGEKFISISIGDWLSTTFTIITLILLVLFLYLFVKWIFKLFSGLLSH